MTRPGDDEAARETPVQAPPPRATGRAVVGPPRARPPATDPPAGDEAAPSRPLPPPPPLSQVAAVAGGTVIGRPGSQSGAWPAIPPPSPEAAPPSNPTTYPRQPAPPTAWAQPTQPAAPAQWAPPPPPAPSQVQAAAQGQAAAQAWRPAEAIPEPPSNPWAPAQAVPTPQAGPVASAPPESTAPPAVTALPGGTTLARADSQAAAAADTSSRATGAQLSAHGIAIPDAGHSGPPDLDDDRRPPDHRRRATLSGRLTRLRIGSHTASRAALTQLRITAAGSGMILGADRQQLPVSVRMFRPDPTRVALVGGVWAGQLVTFRALALGARVAVVTTDPYAWHGFGERATGHGDRVAVLNAEQPLALTGSAHQPILVIYDLGFAGGAAPPPLGPWQTQLTVLRQLGQSGVPSIQECDLVILQRLSSVEAPLAAEALRLPRSSAQFLQVMADDMIALVGGGTERYVWFAQTEVEREQAGGPRR
ncbi:hypothetical protein [Micromonospora sp. NPDC004704]